MIDVKVADFARFGPSGLETLYCKICGTIIGQLEQRPISRTATPDGRIVERLVERFCRNSMYTEMKIAYDDGSAHVTNGCKTCFTTIEFDEFDLQRLTEIDEIDLNLMHRNGKPIAIVKIKVGGGII